jgi:hypothetical protein
MLEENQKMKNMFINKVVMERLDNYDKNKTNALKKAK